MVNHAYRLALEEGLPLVIQPIASGDECGRW
jgi:hypothetical protein